MPVEQIACNTPTALRSRTLLSLGLQRPPIFLCGHLAVLLFTGNIYLLHDLLCPGIHSLAPWTWRPALMYAC